MCASQTRAVIFDLDGVLIRSADCHRRAFERVFEGLGIHGFEYAPYAGWRTPEVIEDVLRSRGRAVDSEVVACSAREKSRLARESIEQTRPLDPYCGAVLAKLGAAYPLALASSGSRASVDAFFKLSGSRSLFRSILCGDDVRNAKPDPEIYTRSARELGLDPSECLVVEDAAAGIEAARAAGAQAVGIAGTSPARDLERAGAACVLPDLGALSGMLKGRRPDPSQWTAIIPAAGRGTRLGFHRPKILFPVAGRMILDWLLDFLEPNCASLVFVVSPEGASEIAAELAERVPGRFEVVVQHNPTGMGDAVALAVPSVRTRHAAIVWGDQVALRRDSVDTCLALHEGPLGADITCPTVLRAKPYIHFERDDQGRIVALRQAREGDAMPETGESDTGFFCFRTERLAELLEAMRADGAGMGSGTREFNFLPVVPRAALDEGGSRVLTPRHMRVEETVGINSAGDAAQVEEFLRRSDGCRV
jgi:HAD superfamily hydrolase (TIGR01509 family)